MRNISATGGGSSEPVRRADKKGGGLQITGKAANIVVLASRELGDNNKMFAAVCGNKNEAVVGGRSIGAGD